MDAVVPDASVGIGSDDAVAVATPPSVASLLHLSEGHLANMRWLGTGPPFIKWRGRVLYPTDALQQWLRDEQVRLGRPTVAAPVPTAVPASQQ